MDDADEVIIKEYCCTCLSKDRNLFQLCRVTDGINNLYWLLSYDSEAYMEGFHKDSASLYICWECKAVMSRICGFRYQACVAQRQLTSISEGRTNKALKVLSKLTHSLKATYDYTYIYSSEDLLIDNFIDCGVNTDVKADSDTDDVPLAELLNNYVSDDVVVKEKKSLSHPSTYLVNSSRIYDNGKRVRKKRTTVQPENGKEKCALEESNGKYHSTVNMKEDEMIESRNMRKLATDYIDAPYKCDDCIKVFKDLIDLEKHHLDMHTERHNQALCDICRIYVEANSLPSHRSEHYLKHTCGFCDFIAFNLPEMMCHLTDGHSVKSLLVPSVKKKNRSGTVTKDPGSRPKRSRAMKDQRTPLGFQCTECDKYFDRVKIKPCLRCYRNKKLRWKHVQKHHRDGFECLTCGKRFPFRNNLTRHEQSHSSTQPRVECPSCGKPVRADLMRVHSLIHSQRERFNCALCQRHFASRASYEHHLRYTRAHAQNDVLKYKCSMCDKGYKSKGELRDHINYRHMGKTQHKCPICSKALATRRCVTRHVKRAHDGIKESERDKICQQCGKAFRDKKGLREHEFIHTGERPLSCEICGCTFRQNATLYTHKKRVHKIYPKRTNVELMEAETAK